MAIITCVDCRKRANTTVALARADGWRLWLGGGQCFACVTANRAQTPAAPLRKVAALDAAAQKAIDVRRRGAMLWMLACAGVPFETIADTLGCSLQSVRSCIGHYRGEIELRARAQRLSNDPVMQRLRAAGAIAMNSGGYVDGEFVSDAYRRAFDPRAPLPSADWPQRAQPPQRSDRK